MAMRQFAKWITTVVVAAMIVGSGWFGLHVPTAAAAGGTIWYVSTTGNDSTGENWTAAFRTLQQALDQADEGDQIWIAAGTYYPTKQIKRPLIEENDPRTAAFQLKSGVAVYGGFKGNDPSETVATRNLVTNRTILSGDLQGDDDAEAVCRGDDPVSLANNAYSVFYHPAGLNLNDTAILDGVTIRGGFANNDKGGNFGGGMYNKGSSPHLENAIIECNYAEAYGGGLHNEDSSVTLTNVIIRNNRAGHSGGGVANFGPGTVTMTDVKIEANRIPEGGGKGGGIFNDGTSGKPLNVVLNNTAITNNVANQGAGMHNIWATVTMNDGRVDGNKEAGLGGGISSVTFSSVTMTDVMVTNNEATRGAGIFAGTGTTLSLTNVTIDRNTSTGTVSTEGGAGILAESATVTMSGGSLTNNVTGGGNGGGIYQNQGALTLHNVDIENNASVGAITGSGGGIYSDRGRVTLTQVTVANNKAKLNGGGIFTAYFSPQVDPVFVMQGGHIRENTAGDRGGGMGNQQTNASLSGVTIVDNVAGTGGGGGLYHYEATVTLSNIRIEGNRATGSIGGGMHNTESSELTLTNVLIAGNEAQLYGGAMANSRSTLNLTNVTIAGNYAGSIGGGGIHNQNTNSVIHNTVIWGNQFRNTTSSITNDAGSSPEIAHSLIQGSWVDDEWNAAVGENHGENIDADPLFVELKAASAGTPTKDGKYQLQTGSPAMGAGNNAYITGYDKDLAGKPRITYGTVDIGAYEFSADPGELTVTAIDPLDAITVIHGTQRARLPLPPEVRITLSDNSSPNVAVTWNDGTPLYKGDTTGTYTFAGTLTMPADVTNPGNLKATVQVTVSAPVPPGGPPDRGNPPAPVTPTDPPPADPPAADPPAFTDIAGHWAAADLIEAASLGFVEGYPDGTFRPDATISRLEFAVIMVRVFGLSGDGTANSFPDWTAVPDWAESDIQLAIEAGILAGYADGSLRPGENVNRAQLAVMVARALNLPLSDSDSPFADASDIPDWARPYVAAVHAAGLMLGQDGNRFAPDVPGTRAEAIVLLMRIWRNLNA